MNTNTIEVILDDKSDYLHNFTGYECEICGSESYSWYWANGMPLCSHGAPLIEVLDEFLKPLKKYRITIEPL